MMKINRSYIVAAAMTVSFFLISASSAFAGNSGAAGIVAAIEKAPVQGRVVQTVRGAPSARLQVCREFQSATAGHLQGVDFYCHQTGTRRMYGIIAGSFYQHEEEYLGPQGTAYWRGVVVKNQVADGQYDPMFISLDYLMEEWR